MDFMESLRKKYSKESMVVMNGTGNTILLHETKGKSVFQTPRRYEVIDDSGALTEEGYFVFNNIPVTDEGSPIFEHRFLQRSGSINSQPGFVAFRLLRPLGSNTYIVLTQWKDEADYHRWETSQSFQEIHTTTESGTGIDSTLHIFSSAPYVTTYTTKKREK